MNRPRPLRYLIVAAGLQALLLIGLGGYSALNADTISRNYNEDLVEDARSEASERSESEASERSDESSNSESSNSESSNSESSNSSDEAIDVSGDERSPSTVRTAGVAGLLAGLVTIPMLYGVLKADPRARWPLMVTLIISSIVGIPPFSIAIALGGIFVLQFHAPTRLLFDPNFVGPQRRRPGGVIETTGSSSDDTTDDERP